MQIKCHIFSYQILYSYLSKKGMKKAVDASRTHGSNVLYNLNLQVPWLLPQSHLSDSPEVEGSGCHSKGLKDTAHGWDADAVAFLQA